ncbi:MAG TPA: TIM-barrel domain-containing protein [Acidobacteriaceae bacterium]|nr:TIM-barrel domain-containing protein [Acidobacteriaceae bacterium]
MKKQSCRIFSRLAFLLPLPLLLLATSSARAQWNPPNPVTSFKQIDDGLEVHQTAGVLRIHVTASAILHITYGPETPVPANPSDGVLAKRDWPPAQFTVESDAKSITLTTAQVRVVIERETGVLAYETLAGKRLTTDSYRQLIPAEVNGEKTSHAEVFFAIYGSKEGLYGLGQHQTGVWNYRGETVDLSQENTNIAIPLLVSSNGYGIFWNNPSRSQVNNRFVHMLYLTAEVADQVDYYFLAGPEPDQIIAHYRELTGDAPMFGRWAYGFWQCKNKYQSQAELEAVAAKYRALHIPVDNIVQDWFWWVTMGEMKWNPNYPDPQGMIKTLHDEHFHLMVSIWPYFRPGSKEYETMDKNGWFIAKTQVGGFHPIGQALYDPTNPKASKFYWDNANTALFKNGAADGVDAWWLDTDEPETEGRAENILIDHKLALGSGARYANIFPNFHTAGVADGQRAASDKKRVFILSRSAYAGSQRNGVTAWSGDVLSDFVTFQRQIAAGLNYAISGMPYWTTDIGGFISGGDLNDPKFRELFVRWFQFGTFSPIFRVHGTRNPAKTSSGPTAPKRRKSSPTTTPSAIASCLISIRRPGASRANAPPLCVLWSWIGAPTRAHKTPATNTCSAHRSSSIPSTFKAQPAAPSTCPKPPGTTSGPAKSSLANKRFKPQRRSINCRFTSAPAQFCRWDQRWSGPPKKQKTPSSCASIPAPTATLRFMKTRTTITTTKKAHTPPSPCTGTTLRTRSPSVLAKAAFRECWRSGFFV